MSVGEWIHRKEKTGHELVTCWVIHYTIFSLLYKLDIFHNKSFFNDSENSEV